MKVDVFIKFHPISEEHMLLSKILPQIFKKFTQIYLSYLWHFATLTIHNAHCVLQSAWSTRKNDNSNQKLIIISPNGWAPLPQIKWIFPQKVNILSKNMVILHFVIKMSTLHHQGYKVEEGNTTFNCFVKELCSPQTQHPCPTYSLSVEIRKKCLVFTTAKTNSVRTVWWGVQCACSRHTGKTIKQTIDTLTLISTIISTAERCSYRRCLQRFPSPPTHPSQTTKASIAAVSIHIASKPVSVLTCTWVQWPRL